MQNIESRSRRLVNIAFKGRFIEGKDWEDTIFYQRVLVRIKKGEFLWDCKNKASRDRRCKDNEKQHLYEA